MHPFVPFRFRRIAQLYAQGLKPLARNSMELSNWNWLYNSTDKLTKGWLKHGAMLLQQVTASAKTSHEGSADDMQRFPSNASSSSSWQSVCGDAFGHTMMDQQLTKLMSKTSGSGLLLVVFVMLQNFHHALPHPQSKFMQASVPTPDPLSLLCLFPLLTLCTVAFSSDHASSRQYAWCSKSFTCNFLFCSAMFWSDVQAACADTARCLYRSVDGD